MSFAIMNDYIRDLNLTHEKKKSHKVGLHFKTKNKKKLFTEKWALCVFRVFNLEELEYFIRVLSLWRV